MDRLLRVIVAHRLRSYRQVIACALGALRPNAQVIEIDPDELDSEVGRLSPQVVICSRATPAVRNAAYSWVELYREHDTGISYVSVGGKVSRVVSEVNLEDLLSIIDRTTCRQSV